MCISHQDSAIPDLSDTKHLAYTYTKHIPITSTKNVKCKFYITDRIIEGRRKNKEGGEREGLGGREIFCESI